VILDDFGYAGFQPIEYIMGFCPANDLLIGRLGGQTGSFRFAFLISDTSDNGAFELRSCHRYGNSYAMVR
jgi:hypothetical protein